MRNCLRSSAIMLSAIIEQASAFQTEQSEMTGNCYAPPSQYWFVEDTKKPGHLYKKQIFTNENVSVAGRKEIQANKPCDKQSASKQSQGIRKRSRIASPMKLRAKSQHDKKKQNDTEEILEREKTKYSYYQECSRLSEKTDRSKLKLKDDRRRSTRNVVQDFTRTEDC